MKVVAIALVFLVAFIMALGLGSYGVFIWPAVAMAVFVGALLGWLPKWSDARVGLALTYAGLFTAGWVQSHDYPDFDRNPGKMFLMAFVVLGGISLLGLAMAIRASKTATILWWIALCVGCALMALYSGDAGGPDPMMAWLTGRGFDHSRAELILLLTRKVVHFTAYGTMALIAYKFAFGSGRIPALKFALVFAIAHGCFDEMRQLTARERSGSPIDVLIDATGAVVFLWMAGAFRKGSVDSRHGSPSR